MRTTLIDDGTVTSVTAKIHDLQTRLARIGGAPSGSIPKSELKGASNRLLPHIQRFCQAGYSWGRPSAYGKYWEAPQVNVKFRSGGEIDNIKFNMRISLEQGGFFDWDEPKSRNPFGNPLLLWMIANDVVLNDQWKCESRAVIQRSIREIHEWCDEIESNPEPEKGPEYYSGLKELVHLAIKQSGKSVYQGKSKGLWELVVKTCGEEVKPLVEFSSNPQFLELLGCGLTIPRTGIQIF